MATEIASLWHILRFECISCNVFIKVQLAPTFGD